MWDLIVSVPDLCLSFYFGWFIPVQILIVPNGKYPHSQVVICPTLLDSIHVNLKVCETIKQV